MPIEPLHTEKELLFRIAKGDETAFNSIVAGYTHILYSAAFSYIKIAQSAEDVTQEVFYKIWKSRNKLAGIDCLADYLFILTRNEVLSTMRKKGPQYPVGEYLENSLAEKEGNPEQSLSVKHLQEDIQTAVSLLPPQQKQAYWLSREMQLSHEEIAVQMGISKNTVKNHIVAALNFIRKYIQAHSDTVLLLLIPLLAQKIALRIIFFLPLAVSLPSNVFRS